jgi:hypothetical protein
MGLNPCKCTSYIEKMAFNTEYFHSTNFFNRFELYFDQHYIFKAHYNVIFHEINSCGPFLQIKVSLWLLMAIEIRPF